MRTLIYWVSMVALVLVLGACSKEESTNSNDIRSLEGTVSVDGSSTVYPIIEAVAEEFQMYAPNVRVSIGVSGTGGGFKALIADTIDVANASRGIKLEEVNQLKANGMDYTEFKIANDGISIVVSKENDWVDSLTVEELKQIYVENGKTRKWSDIRPEWPNEEIKLYSPGTDSGTYDYFNEVVLEDAQINMEAMLSEDDNILVQGISGDKYSLGYLGYAYYIVNESRVRAIPIDNGNGPIAPTNETIESNDYAPFSRPLFIYANNTSIKEQAVYEYIKFTLENAGELVEEVGYVRLVETDYVEALNVLETLR